ncbi:GPI mannosyltransferase 4 [Copidosoma floridanum]|uniref:GPI mannosyltransferase 4 n=1 Tax=Copidosoma floridanum TaxID=29053 RepID=UPI0006C944CD|nr:GPI mannosyltransferase 4 [Copidosoma floridanum]
MRHCNPSFCCLSNENHRIFHFCSKRSVYWIFACLRIVLNFIPQTGYIHPDEYFQFIEVAAGDTFDIEVYKPWEFNVTFPVRNSLIPQLCVKFPYFLLQGLNPYCEHFFGTTLKSPYFLVVFPRLMMTILSFISDYCLYKICLILHEPYINRLTVFASSYIVLVHCTRTLSNSIEIVLTSILLYHVARCIELSNKVVVQNDFLMDKYHKAKTGVERTKIYKLRGSLPLHSLNDCLLLATVTAFGIFNRPTFIAFAGPPIFFWFQRGLGSISIGFLDFHIRFYLFVFFTIPTILAMILFDSLYFGYLTIAEISSFEISINNFVVTPLNFLKYNSVTNNLKHHGLHPRFLHFLVNMPLLFNVVGVIAVITLIKMLNSFLRGKWLELPRIQSIESLMISSFAVPVALLSIFPHQEPRFIVPVLLPLVFLFAHWVEDPLDASTVNVAPETNQQTSTTSSRVTEKNVLKIIWYVSNIILAIFYGFLHQGGVLPLTSHLSKELKSKPYLTHIHVMTSHTYPIPTGLLHLRNTKKEYTSNLGHKYTLTKDFYVDELGSSDAQFINNRICQTIKKCEYKWHVKKIPYRLYYALPSSFYNEFKYSGSSLQCTNNTAKDYKFHIVQTFSPHLSIEHMPKVDFFHNFFSASFIFSFDLAPKLPDKIFGYLQQFDLLLLRIENPNER